MPTECNSPPPQKKPGVFPFAIAITVLNILGHTWLGFEQPWLTPFVAVFTAYACEISIEVGIQGWVNARFRAGWSHLFHFLLPAHISGLAVGMLLYTNENLVVVAFAASVAIYSKVLLRVPAPGSPHGVTTHFLNPSNFGIAITLLVFHEWVGVAQPYQFTENIYGDDWYGQLDWVLPVIILCSGSFLNWRATKRIPLILAWLSGFVLQAVVRSMLSPQNILPMLAPMTGMAFVLFTFYMVTDPMTTPRGKQGQVAFGLSTAAVYGLLSHSGIAFGFFFALCIVCIARGALLAGQARWFRRAATSSSAPKTIVVETQNA